MSIKALASILIAPLLFMACDKCRKVDCQHGQSCENGTCACSQWYEGERCEQITIQRYSGTYEGDFTCAGANGDDQLEISGTKLTNVLTMNVSGSELEMRFSDVHHFMLTPDTLRSALGDYTVSGEGDISGNTLSMDLYYHFEEGNAAITCTLDMHK